MECLGRRSASSALKAVLDLAWYLGLAGVAVMVLFQVRFLMGGWAGSLQITTPGLVFRFTGGIPDLRALLVFQFSVIFYWLAGLLVLYQLRGIFATLAAGTPFSGDNVRRIRIIGMAVIAGSLLKTVVYTMIGLHIADLVQVPGLEVQGRIELDLGGIFLGMVVLVLAEVFRHGARLQEEQDLTV